MAIALLLPLFLGTASEVPSTKPETALILVDIQMFYFEGGKVPLTGANEASLAAARLLKAARERGWPVLHVRHVPEAVAAKGEPFPAAYGFHPNVSPRAGEIVITKNQINSFRGTDLLDHLRRLGTKKVILAGMQTHMCLEAAARASADLGFEVMVAAEACATRPLEYGGRKVSAEDVQASTLAALAGNYARVTTVDDLLR